MQADTAKLEAILVDTYVDTDEGGHQSDKSGTLAVLKSGDLKFKTIKLSNMKVYTYGDAGSSTAWPRKMAPSREAQLGPRLCSPTRLSCKTGYGRRQRHIDYRAKMRSLAGLCTFTKSALQR